MSPRVSWSITSRVAASATNRNAISGVVDGALTKDKQGDTQRPE